jgi:hypothetical protein
LDGYKARGIPLVYSLTSNQIYHAQVFALEDVLARVNVPK